MNCFYQNSKQSVQLIYELRVVITWFGSACKALLLVSASPLWNISVLLHRAMQRGLALWSVQLLC